METKPGLKGLLESQMSGHSLYLWADFVPEAGAMTEKEHFPQDLVTFSWLDNMEVITTQSSQNTFSDFFYPLRCGHFNC